MIKSYLSLALRIMVGQRGFVFINLSGLTIGIACSLLLFLYIQDELSFDRFHRDAHRIYRVGFESKLQGREIKSAETGAPLAAALQETGLVESTLRLANWPTFPLRYEDRSFTEPYLLLADSNFFSFFDFELVAGDEKALYQKDQLVVSESAARRYFDYKGNGDSSAIGKMMTLAQGYQARVAAIAKDAPASSHFHFSVILSLPSWTELQHARWTNGVVLTYFKKKNDIDLVQVNTALDLLVEREVGEEVKELHKLSLTEFEQQGNYLGFFIQPLTHIHLRSDLADEIETNGNIEYIYLFGAIAVFITVLACINFINLSTARSSSRAKEVGVRKTVGAHYFRLIGQFLMESLLFTAAAVLLALGIVRLTLVPFNVLTEKEIPFSVFYQPAFLLPILVFILLVGLIAGSYPAFYLARFSPMEVLRGRVGKRRYGIRNVLVVFQFFISITLIIATLVVYRQLRFIQVQNTGFNKENIVNLLHAANLRDNAAVFKKELLSVEGVEQVSFANRLPPNIDWQSTFRVAGIEKDHLLAVYEMDYDHLNTMGYQLKSGRFFSPNETGDTLALLLNESAMRSLGLQGKPIDSVRLTSTYDARPGAVRQLIGVMADFNFRSLKEPIQPLAIVLSKQPNWELAIRLNKELDQALVNTIEAKWRKFAPGAPFEYTLVEDNFRSKYEREKRIGSVFLIFTVLAIFIACLGVFGLATYMAEQRTKEIGIRKVLGANVLDVVLLLTLNFMKLILIAFALAAPLAWWALNSWLSQYAYHIDPPVWAFALAGILALLFALLSASYRSFRAAFSNPVESLRSE